MFLRFGKLLARLLGVPLLLAVALGSAYCAEISLNEEIKIYRQTHALDPFTTEPRLTLAAQKLADKLAKNGPKSVPANFLEKALTDENYSAANANAIVNFAPQNARHILEGFIAKPSDKSVLLTSGKWEIGSATYSAPPHKAYTGTAQILVVILAQPRQSASRNWQQETLNLVNQFRKENRLPPLKLNEKLNKAAQAHADDMFVRDFFDHISPSGSNPGQRAALSGYKWQLILENLATGQPTPVEAVTGWKNSKTGHREAMLNPKITEAGIGYRFMANDLGKYQGQHYWAMSMGLSLN